jgi:glycine oxidase
VIIGAGVIGLSLACELRRHGASVIILERHQPGREASWASGGMIAHCEAGPHPLLRALAYASAKLYPAFAHTLQDESGIDLDIRSEGKIVEYSGRAVLLPEAHLDPRALLAALIQTALHLGVEIDSGADVQTVELAQGCVHAAVTSKTRYVAKAIVNCAGAWAGSMQLTTLPVRPIKGHMLCLVSQSPVSRHVVHGNGVYVIPRSDGRSIIGSTIEDVGFDKRVVPETIQRLHQAAAILIPQLGEARIHDSWAGLRPCTPDKLPAMGRTAVEGYFAATGHYRDGILLAPITARLMAQLVLNQPLGIDIEEFSPLRFASQ